MMKGNKKRGWLKYSDCQSQLLFRQQMQDVHRYRMRTIWENEYGEAVESAGQKCPNGECSGYSPESGSRDKFYREDHEYDDFYCEDEFDWAADNEAAADYSNTHNGATEYFVYEDSEYCYDDYEGSDYGRYSENEEPEDDLHFVYAMHDEHITYWPVVRSDAFDGCEESRVALYDVNEPRPPLTIVEIFDSDSDSGSSTLKENVSSELLLECEENSVKKSNMKETLQRGKDSEAVASDSDTGWETIDESDSDESTLKGNISSALLLKCEGETPQEEPESDKAESEVESDSDTGWETYESESEKDFSEKILHLKETPGSDGSTLIGTSSSTLLYEGEAPQKKTEADMAGDCVEERESEKDGTADKANCKEMNMLRFLRLNNLTVPELQWIDYDHLTKHVQDCYENSAAMKIQWHRAERVPIHTPQASVTRSFHTFFGRRIEMDLSRQSGIEDLVQFYTYLSSEDYSRADTIIRVLSVKYVRDFYPKRRELSYFELFKMNFLWSLVSFACFAVTIVFYICRAEWKAQQELANKKRFYFF